MSYENLLFKILLRHILCMKYPFGHLYRGTYGDILQKLTGMNFFLYKQKVFFLSRRRIPLVTLKYEQVIHLTKITLRPNTQFLSNPQHAYQSF